MLCYVYLFFSAFLIIILIIYKDVNVIAIAVFFIVV